MRKMSEKAQTVMEKGIQAHSLTTISQPNNNIHDIESVQ